MRDYKFRGKRKDNGEWVYGHYFQTPLIDENSGVPSGCGWCFLCDGKTRDCISQDGVAYVVDPSTIGQYTGLQDKHGKEIFEGDLLRFPAKDDWERTNYVSYEVFFHDNDCAERHVGWQMNRLHLHGAIAGGSILATFLPEWTRQMEIEGNIHDNPSLLEGGERRG